MCTMDIKNFYLGTPLPAGDKEYMWIDAAHFTTTIIADYNLQQFVVPFHQSYRILMRVCKTIYGLKKAGALSKRKLDYIKRRSKRTLRLHSRNQRRNRRPCRRFLHQVYHRSWTRSPTTNIRASRVRNYIRPKRYKVYRIKHQIQS